MRPAILALAMAAPLLGATAPEIDHLRSLSKSHQWFALRDAVAQMEDAPLLYRGAVACSFHDVKGCEQDMQQVIREGSPAERADAHGFLMLLYAMTGRFRQAKLDSEQWTRERGAPATDSLQAVLSAFGDSPDLAVESRRRSVVRYERAAGHLLVPASVNGGVVKYILDTGANFSIVSESEARRLGLQIVEVNPTKLADSAGRGIALGRVAIAARLEIGKIRLRNVPFLVVDDNLEVLADLPPGSRGALGMQVLLALGTIRWNASGTVELAGRVKGGAQANLCFDGLLPLTEGSFDGTNLVFVLDTGDSESRLFPRFAREFAAMVVERGRPGVWRLSGAGGTVNARTTVLPSLSLELGGLTASLEPVHILARGFGSDVHHGTIGMDALNQAGEITLDFQSMRMTLSAR